MNNYLRKRNDFDLFDEDFLHDVFGFTNKKFYNIMKTDIEEKEDGFQFNIEMPGYEKENIKIQLEKGYLTIDGSTKSKDENNKENKSHYIRKERYYGSVSRSYYVGDDVKQEDIKAVFKNGILNLFIPKVDHSQVEEKKYITIE